MGSAWDGLADEATLCTVLYLKAVNAMALYLQAHDESQYHMNTEVGDAFQHMRHWYHCDRLLMGAIMTMTHDFYVLWHSLNKLFVPDLSSCVWLYLF